MTEQSSECCGCDCCTDRCCVCGEHIDDVVVTQRHVQVGPQVLEFTSFQQWVDKGKSWYANCGVRSHKLINLDAKGRVVVSGKEFMRARDDGSFPVTVYSIEPPETRAAKLERLGIGEEDLHQEWEGSPPEPV